jgi:hypothetical protein
MWCFCRINRRARRTCQAEEKCYKASPQIQALSRSLKEEVLIDKRRAVSLEWGSYPILDFTEVREIELVLINRSDQPPLDVGETASLPVVPAIANALFDATGVRFYRAPLLRSGCATDSCIFRSLIDFVLPPAPCRAFFKEHRWNRHIRFAQSHRAHCNRELFFDSRRHHRKKQCP